MLLPWYTTTPTTRTFIYRRRARHRKPRSAIPGRDLFKISVFSLRVATGRPDFGTRFAFGSLIVYRNITNENQPTDIFRPFVPIEFDPREIIDYLRCIRLHRR